MHLAPDARLIVIDCQEGFISEHSAGIIDTVDQLATLWRDRGLPVYFTRFVNTDGSPYERLINWSRCKGSPDTDIVPKLRHHLTEGAPLVTKHVYTFFTPQWVEQAKRERWTDVVLVGIDTDGCVLKTALDAFELDLTPWIVTDACASHSGPKAQDAALYIAGRVVGKGQLVQVAEVAAAALRG